MVLGDGAALGPGADSLQRVSPALEPRRGQRGDARRSNDQRRLDRDRSEDASTRGIHHRTPGRRCVGAVARRARRQVLGRASDALAAEFSAELGIAVRRRVPGVELVRGAQRQSRLAQSRRQPHPHPCGNGRSSDFPGRRRGRGSQGGAEGSHRFSQGSNAHSEPGRAHAQGCASRRTAGHRQDIAGAGRCRRIRRAVLQHQRFGVHRAVRRRGSGARARTVRTGAAEGALHHFHRRVGRRRRRSRHRSAAGGGTTSANRR